jgi:hypothetical protein
MAPPGFKIDYAKNDRYADGRPLNLDWHLVNTCAVRLSDALTRVDPQFFHGVNAGAEWHEPIKSDGRNLPMNAGALAIALRHKIGKPIQVLTPSVISGRRGVIFFDTITGYAGTGHISLWDGNGVVDGGNYFPYSPRVYFWQL